MNPTLQETFPEKVLPQVNSEKLDSAKDNPTHEFGFLDSFAKKEIRRTLFKAVSIPGYQVPYSSREMPIARGFGTG
ncbi:MAG: alpha-D-ribose 1-methylphosphonate 5-phosphate C-P-lyase PhnJ, partial [Cyanobacteria bacterium J06643_5]